MKAILCLLIFLSGSFFAQSQTFNSSCVPSGDMAAIFRNDAYRLATKRVFDINSTWKDSVNIPESYIDSFARALYAIQNMEYSPLKDTITTMFGSSIFLPDYFGLDSSHTGGIVGDWHYSYRIKSFFIKTFDNASPEALDSINELMVKYDLHSFPQIYTTQVYSDRAINIPAILKQFKAISGIQYAETNFNPGLGREMGADFVNGDVILTYVMGCGDCLSGCTFGRTWQFKVHTSTDCSVEFLSAENWGLIVILTTLELCYPAIVPIEFTSIKASQKNNYQLVEWQMAAEDNVASYTIERSADGINYRSIGETVALGRSLGPINYSWKDVDILNGKYYYRIRIVEKSGATKYSSIATLNVKANAGIIVQPTLIRNGLVSIQFNKVAKGNYTVELLNTTGQKLFSTVVDVNAEVFNKVIQLPANISTGMYVVSVRGKEVQPNQFVFISR